MEDHLDAEPDEDVHALQSLDALLMTARSTLRPALLRAEQRQRARECNRRRRAKSSDAPTSNESAA